MTVIGRDLGFGFTDVATGTSKSSIPGVAPRDLPSAFNIRRGVVPAPKSATPFSDARARSLQRVLPGQITDLQDLVAAQAVLIDDLTTRVEDLEGP